jgi:hypothetical protein
MGHLKKLRQPGKFAYFSHRKSEVLNFKRFATLATFWVTLEVYWVTLEVYWVTLEVYWVNFWATCFLGTKSPPNSAVLMQQAALLSSALSSDANS